jgi:hypothetical protein
MALDTNSTSYQPKYLSRGVKAIVLAGFAAVLVWEVDSGTFVFGKRRARASPHSASLRGYGVGSERWPGSPGRANEPKCVS